MATTYFVVDSSGRDVCITFNLVDLHLHTYVEDALQVTVRGVTLQPSRARWKV